MLVRYSTTMIAGLVLASPVSGHHSDADLDMESLVTIEGTVTAFHWRNPHVYFTVETTDEGGEPVEWAMQMSSIITASRQGWTRDSLAVGDQVTVGLHPARNGRPYGLMDSIDRQTGDPLPTSFDRATGEPLLAEPQVTASTSTLEGRWMADRSKLVSYPGGFDGFFIANLKLTENGEAARAAFDESSDENPAFHCIGRPTPSMIITTNIYPLEVRFNADDRIIVLRSEYFDDTRTVYMDGRGHPEGERYHSGHSIGRWEGDVLVVDTTNFSDHRSPYQIGVASGAQKHVVERYRLIEEGTRVAVEFFLEDPEYLAEPLIHSRELMYSPHEEMYRFNCDPEATSRFVR